MREEARIPVVLLVEDNPVDEKLTLRALKSCGVPHQVVVAQDGAEAIDLLFGDKPTKMPALILLDLKLPKVGGLEILQRLRAEQHTKRIPVVVLTSSDVEGDILMSYDIGVNSYIQKPIDYEAYTRMIQEIGRYWLTMNRNP